MAERTTTLRPLIAPLRRTGELAPVADALENAQVQLDALVKRVATVEDSSSAETAAPAEAPGPVTSLSASSTVFWERGIPWQKITIAGNAPEAATYNDFTGVLVFHVDSASKQTRSGWIPLSTAAGAEFSFDVYVPAPADPLTTEYVTVYTRNADLIAASGVTVEMIGADVPDDTLKDVTVAGTPTKTWLANGDLRLSALRSTDPAAGYIPPWIGNSPSNIGSFQGVDVFWENEDTPLDPYPAAAPPYTGTAGGTTPTNYGEVNVTIPRGYLTEGTHYLILRSYGRSSRLGWKQHTLVPATCYWAITITSSELTANPSDGTTPGQPTGVSAIVQPGSTPEKFTLGVAFTPPTSLDGTVGYAHRYRYWLESGKTNLHWPTDGSWIEAGRVPGANLTQIIAGEYDRDGIPVYAEAAVNPFNDRNELGSWVVSGTAALVSPRSDETSGQSAAVSLAISAGPDSRTYMATATLTPPSPIGMVRQWECEMGFWTLETGGSQTGAYTPLAPPIDVNDTTEPFGPFPRGIDQEPWAELRTRFVYTDGSKGAWIYAARKQVTKQPAPSVTLTNITTKIEGVDKDTGIPLYGFLKGAGLSGAKDALDKIQVESKIWTDAGLTVVDEDWKDLGGLDPKLNDTWPTTSTQPTDLWPLHGYTIYTKVRIRAVNSDGVYGSWIESSVMVFAASPGLDAGQIDTSTIGGTFLISGGKLTNYALTELAKWGLDEDDFDGTNPGNLQLNNAVIARLLTQSITLTGTMTILDSGGNQNIRLDSTGILLGTASRYVNLASGGVYIVEGTSRLDLTASAIQMKIGGTAYVDVTTSYTVVSNIFQVKSGGTAYMTVDSSKCQLQVEFEPWGTLDFTNAGSVSMGSKASDWRTAMGVSQKITVTGRTLTLAKITSGGTDGSITFDNEGRVTGGVDPT